MKPKFIRGFAVLAASLLFIFVLLNARATVAAVSPEDFLVLPGALAFKAGRFEEALRGFLALVENSPDDLLALRYLGITYDRLARYQEAVTTFRKGLSVEPDNPALNFFLGVALFKMGDQAAATQTFERVLKLAPGSVYGKHAQEYLAAMNQESSVQEPRGAPRRWNLLGQLGFQFDDNVPSAPPPPGNPTGSSRGGFAMTEYIYGAYQFLKTGPWSAKVEFASSQSQHPEDGLHRFDVATTEPSVEARYVVPLFERMVVSPILRYDFKQVWLSGHKFSTSNGVTAKLDTNLDDRWILSPYYRFQSDDFRDEGFSSKVSSRDDKNHSAGATLYYLFWQKNAHLRVGYQHQENRADRSNFDFSGNAGFWGFNIPVIEEIYFDFGQQIGFDHYDHFRGPPRRSAAQQTYTAGLYRSFGNFLFLSLTNQYVFANSNFHQAFEYARDVVSLSVAVKY